MSLSLWRFVLLQHHVKNAFRDVKGTAESSMAEQDRQVVPKFRSSLTAYHYMDITAAEITPDNSHFLPSLSTPKGESWMLSTLLTFA